MSCYLCEGKIIATYPDNPFLHILEGGTKHLCIGDMLKTEEGREKFAKVMGFLK